MAHKVLNEREEKNPVTSIILLSDGCDDYGTEKCKDSVDRVVDFYEYGIGSYTIHTFGYGNHHDSEIMTYISN